MTPETFVGVRRVPHERPFTREDISFDPTREARRADIATMRAVADTLLAQPDGQTDSGSDIVTWPYRASHYVVERVPGDNLSDPDSLSAEPSIWIHEMHARTADAVDNAGEAVTHVESFLLEPVSDIRKVPQQHSLMVSKRAEDTRRIMGALEHRLALDVYACYKKDADASGVARYLGAHALTTLHADEDAQSTVTIEIQDAVRRARITLDPERSQTVHSRPGAYAGEVLPIEQGRQLLALQALREYAPHEPHHVENVATQDILRMRALASIDGRLAFPAELADEYVSDRNSSELGSVLGDVAVLFMKPELQEYIHNHNGNRILRFSMLCLGRRGGRSWHTLQFVDGHDFMLAELQEDTYYRVVALIEKRNRASRAVSILRGEATQYWGASAVTRAYHVAREVTYADLAYQECTAEQIRALRWKEDIDEQT